MQAVREPAVAGMFYPSGESQLREQLELLFDIAASEQRYNNVLGLVAPHAGYIYSGRTAAFGFNAVSGKKYDKSIVISPSHREYFPGISVFEGDAYKTPMGIVDVDKELREIFLQGSKSIFSGVIGHKAEHALEVQLPFLQFLYPDIKILPVVIGDQSKVFADELAEKLAAVTDDNTLIVASSDLSHFYSREHGNKLDSIIAEHIAAFEFDKLQEDLETRNCEACGGGGIVALMKAGARINRTNSKVIHRSDSGDTTGDTSDVVGYLSAIVY